MKRKLKALISFLIVISALLSGMFAAFANALEPDDEIESILEYKLKKSNTLSVQNFIDRELSASAGTGAEWYIIALSQYKSYNFSEYEEALCKYLCDNTVRSASSRQKYAIALVSVGSTDTYIYDTVNDSIGKQGIMSLVFGLHLLNNGYTCRTYSKDALKNEILSMQHTDGGWSVTGANGDVDVTAMTLQALSPYYKSDKNVEKAVDCALEFLSCAQKDTGDYSSYGINNSESTAQVLTALSSLGIDARIDSRFIKCGNTVFDALEMYRLNDGSFCHSLDNPASSEMSTAQVLYSMVSYVRMKNSKSTLFIFDNRNPTGLKIPHDTTVTSVISDESTSDITLPVSEATTYTTLNQVTDDKTAATYYIPTLTEAVADADNEVVKSKETNSGSFFVVIIIAALVIFALIIYFLKNSHRKK